VIASQYEEILVDRLYDGNVQLNTTLRELVAEAEQTLQLDEEKRRRTLLRIDAGGGAFVEKKWLLKRVYRLHCKKFSSRRAQKLGNCVKKWIADSKV
jgi:hypothetical protein